MATGYIQLVLGDLSVRCRMFLDGPYPRKHVEPVKPERSVLGAFINYGRFYEESHLWVFQAIVRDAEAEKLEAMYWEHQRLRKAYLNASILLIDTTRTFKERTPRTRALAPAPHDAVTQVGAHWISYYAQYWAWFDAQPEFTQAGQAHTIMQLSLIEYRDKVAP